MPRRKVYQSPDFSDFKVDVDIECCVHGYLDKDRKQAASLIIFASQLVCVDKGSFNRFKMEVDFRDRERATFPCKPEVICTAPFSSEEPLNPDVRVIKVKNVVQVENSVEAKMTAGLGGQLGRKTQHTKEEECTYEVRYFSKGASNTHCDKSGHRNGVWWNVKKASNSDAKDDAGIPPNYRFAVLVLRANGSTPFEAHIRLFVEAGWAHKKDKVLQILSRGMLAKRRPESKIPESRSLHNLVNLAFRDSESELGPMVFDPRTKFEGRCEGIKRDMLKKYQMEGELAALTVLPKEKAKVKA